MTVAGAKIAPEVVERIAESIAPKNMICKKNVPLKTTTQFYWPLENTDGYTDDLVQLQRDISPDETKWGFSDKRPTRPVTSQWANNLHIWRHSCNNLVRDAATRSYLELYLIL